MTTNDWRDELVAKMDIDFLEFAERVVAGSKPDTPIPAGPAVTIYMPRVSVEPTPCEPLYQRRTKTPKETTCRSLK